MTRSDTVAIGTSASGVTSSLAPRVNHCGHHPLEPGWNWVDLILAMWLVISPFVVFVSGAGMWNSVVLGIIIGALALNHTHSKASAYT